ncbi:E3 ubiquitin-protein ligase RNF220 isoform X2 [Procambarus clarkii]|uniref:E3 ubiquitin-protein ligase RNF220 isoform X2 n=1 Tax=Procambarus clarkii TaxID=6728 RepID=UPI0037437CAB
MESEDVGIYSTSSPPPCSSVSSVSNASSSTFASLATHSQHCTSNSICASSCKEDMEVQELKVRLRTRRTRGISTSDNADEGRQKRRKPRPGESWCPVCGVTLRPGEMDAHLTHELDKLVRLPQTRPLSQRTPTPTTSTPTPSTSSESNATTKAFKSRYPVSGRNDDKSWKTYQRVRHNRQLRVRAKRRRTAEDQELEAERTCPVCDQHFPLHDDDDDDDDVITHIDECLRRAEDEDEDVEVELEVEEYEWCGQTRVRATQMLRAEGQLHALGTKVVRGSEEELVDVCGDDSSTVYGPVQYSDADLPSPHNDCHSDTELVDNHTTTTPAHHTSTVLTEAASACNGQANGVGTSGSGVPTEAGTSGSSVPTEAGTSGSSVPTEAGTSGSSVPTEAGTSGSSVPTEAGSSGSSVPAEAGTSGSSVSAEAGTSGSGVSTEAGTSGSSVSAEAGTSGSGVSTEAGTSGSGVSTEAGTSGSGVSTEAGTSGSGVSTEAGTSGSGVSTEAGTSGSSVPTEAGTSGSGVSTEAGTSGSSHSLSPESVNSTNPGRPEGSGGGGGGGGGSLALVEALRARLQELEEETPRGRYSCRVCHGEYVRPLVSVVCWHVHCQECWLPALAAKKLCPQCSVITAPGDLRRVYL